MSEGAEGHASHLYRCYNVARACDGAVGVFELYDGPTERLEELEIILTAVNDPQVEKYLEAARRNRAMHDQMRAGGGM